LPKTRVCRRRRERVAKTSSRTDSSRSEIREMRTGETVRKKSRRSSDRCETSERKLEGQPSKASRVVEKKRKERGVRTVETIAERTLAALRLTFQVASSSSSYLATKEQVSSERSFDATGEGDRGSLFLEVLILVLLVLAIVHLLVVFVVSSVVLKKDNQVSERIGDRGEGSLTYRVVSDELNRDGENRRDEGSDFGRALEDQALQCLVPHPKAKAHMLALYPEPKRASEGKRRLTASPTSLPSSSSSSLQSCKIEGITSLRTWPVF